MSQLHQHIRRLLSGETTLDDEEINQLANNIIFLLQNHKHTRTNTAAALIEPVNVILVPARGKGWIMHLTFGGLPIMTGKVAQLRANAMVEFRAAVDVFMGVWCKSWEDG